MIWSSDGLCGNQRWLQCVRWWHEHSKNTCNVFSQIVCVCSQSGEEVRHNDQGSENKYDVQNNHTKSVIHTVTMVWSSVIIHAKQRRRLPTTRNTSNAKKQGISNVRALMLGTSSPHVDHVDFHVAPPKQKVSTHDTTFPKVFILLCADYASAVGKHEFRRDVIAVRGTKSFFKEHFVYDAISQ